MPVTHAHARQNDTRARKPNWHLTDSCNVLDYYPSATTLTTTQEGNTMATNQLNASVLQATIAKLNAKLTRQKNAVAETEQHIAAIMQLIENQKATK